MTNPRYISGTLTTDDRLGYPKNQSITINNKKYCIEVTDIDAFPDGSRLYKFEMYFDEE